MTVAETLMAKTPISLPDIPVLTVFGKNAALLTKDGELKTLGKEHAILEINNDPVLVCHAPYTRHRLGENTLQCFDILELFAFVHPAKFCVPTPLGLAQALGISMPKTFDDYPFTLIECMEILLQDLQNEVLSDTQKDPAEIASVMGQQGKGWNWTPYIFLARGHVYEPQSAIISRSALNVWKELPEWGESPPAPPPSHYPVTDKEARDSLSTILTQSKKNVEPRPQQERYATQITPMFSPLDGDNIDPVTGEVCPHVVLAEAGTGVGKTLGYLAPSHVWSQKNEGSVWISTYTKNLQRQINQELDMIYPDPDIKDAHVAVRKGRENYLCLLNLEDMSAGAGVAKHPNQAIAAGIMARWTEKTNEGDLSGGDFPGWLSVLLGYHFTRGLSDRRGECIYSACDHYRRCFVEKALRKTQSAKIVVANHAVIMIQTALSAPGEELPSRYVFDEGHHLFDAADSAFSSHLSARETHDLRRWLRGAEAGKRTRARGLQKRIEDLLAGDDEDQRLLLEIIQMAGNLPAYGWSRRLKDRNPQGATEEFLMTIYDQVYARSSGRNTPYSLETETRPVSDSALERAVTLQNKLKALQKPMQDLSTKLKKRLNDHADTLDADTKKRLESVAAGLDRRGEMTLAGWIDMLGSLSHTQTPPDYVDWMEIERIDGKAVDVGLYRHWKDPMKPFSSAIKPHAHGMAVTSATLCDRTENENENWRVADERSGAQYLSPNIMRFQEESPYDYASQSRVFILDDVDKANIEQLSTAYRILFDASGGGALGLFTAIQRLRGVQSRIVEPLENMGYPLYAQHADDIDTGTLVDMFREDTKACLLGTDAIRDGVDIPGDSLRLLVYDRVPWPRPSILHKARRKEFGGRRYDELSTRLKLRQAFGRLIRTENDKGVFVMTDSMLPTRLLNAFPDGVPIERISLSEANLAIRSFLG